MIKLDQKETAHFKKLKREAIAHRALLAQSLAHFELRQGEILAQGSKLWDAIKARYDLQGDWRYENGQLFAVNAQQVNEGQGQQPDGIALNAAMHPNWPNGLGVAEAEGNTSDIEPVPNVLPPSY